MSLWWDAALDILDYIFQWLIEDGILEILRMV